MADELDLDDDEAFMDSGGEEDDDLANVDSSEENSDDPGIEVMGEDDDTHQRSSHLTGKGDSFEYKVLGPDQIVEEMQTLIKDVAAIVHLPPTTCRILLHHYKWNKESLLERFYEASDPDKFFRDAHVVSPFPHTRTSADSACSSGSFQPQQFPKVTRCPKEEFCSICCTTVPSSSIDGLECGHRFCVYCWASYLTNKVMEEGRGQTIACPQHKCEIFVDDAKAMQLINSEDVKRRDCGKAVKVAHNDTKPVTCDCGLKFCFSCGQEWHEPVNCRLLKLWQKKCSDDSETSNWISANTKECPKCHVTIEKDGGCNHMTCKSTSCRYEFCWLCLGAWEPHGNSWYACNRFDDSASKTARDAQERGRAALQRYLFYYNRYIDHQNSLRLETKLYQTTKMKMEQMQQQNMSWIEVQFLKTAVDILSQCRRTLMYTYAFAFYLQRDNQAEIFESAVFATELREHCLQTNQRDLEVSTETLSGFLERDLENEDLVTLKQKVQDLYRYVEERRRKLLEHCAEGTEKGEWRYTVAF